MFSNRKYSSLPTNSASHRKRSGGSMSTWKRWTVLAMIGLLIVALGYSRYGHKSYGDEVWDAAGELS